MRNLPVLLPWRDEHPRGTSSPNHMSAPYALLEQTA